MSRPRDAYQRDPDPPPPPQRTVTLRSRRGCRVSGRVRLRLAWPVTAETVDGSDGRCRAQVRVREVSEPLGTVQERWHVIAPDTKRGRGSWYCYPTERQARAQAAGMKAAQ